MKTHFRIIFIVTILIFTPCQTLYADECDNDYQQANMSLELARAAHQEKDYASAAKYYEEAAGNFERIAERGECWCPKILKAAPANAQKYYQKANECKSWVQKTELYEEYNRAVRICKEGHDCARKRNFADAIRLFEEAAEIWERIGESADSQYSQSAIAEAAKAREAAEYARRYIE